jgi:hypothetical protein
VPVLSSSIIWRCGLRDSCFRLVVSYNYFLAVSIPRAFAHGSLLLTWIFVIELSAILKISSIGPLFPLLHAVLMSFETEMRLAFLSIITSIYCVLSKWLVLSWIAASFQVLLEILQSSFLLDEHIQYILPVIFGLTRLITSFHCYSSIILLLLPPIFYLH